MRIGLIRASFQGFCSRGRLFVGEVTCRIRPAGEFSVQPRGRNPALAHTAHKVVVEPRLKGAGMHWAPDRVNPMVALCTAVWNDRWKEAWPKIAAQLRHQATQRRQALKEKRQQAVQSQPPSPALTSPPVPLPTSIVEPEANTQSDQNRPPAPPQKQSPYRPASNHPWRRSPIGRARFQTNTFSKN